MCQLNGYIVFQLEILKNILTKKSTTIRIS
nr:MAG TPA: hypothetical protein [Caudoviricetes sp.]